jgi:hypothetical protein
MIKKISVLIVFILFIIQYTYSQQKLPGSKPILFRGVVMDASTQERLIGSDILVNRKVSAISADDGTFSFYAFKRDTLRFKMLGYKGTTMIVSDTLLATEFLTGVYLESDSTLLGEVIIVPKIANLRAEMIKPVIKNDPLLENAVSNITTASYVGRTTEARLGDPATNYNYLKTKMKYDAFERGTIPSEKILGLSPFLIVPAAYLLIYGVAELPPPPKAQISAKDMNELRKKYLETTGKVINK